MHIFETLRAEIAREQPVALATVVAGPGLGAKLLIRGTQDRLGTLGDRMLDADVCEDALALLAVEQNETRRYTVADQAVDVLVETYPPPPHLVIVGAVHSAMVLTTMAKLLGFRVTVIDPRTVRATADRFPDADALIAEWPDEALSELPLHRSTYVVVLTHDPKIDDPAVRIALRSPARYVGALGSQQTQQRRRETLAAAGVEDEHLRRLYGPIGLPIGARTPSELAVSILAEIVAVRRGKR